MAENQWVSEIINLLIGVYSHTYIWILYGVITCYNCIHNLGPTSKAVFVFLVLKKQNGVHHKNLVTWENQP